MLDVKNLVKVTANTHPQMVASDIIMEASKIAEMDPLKVLESIGGYHGYNLIVKGNSSV